MQQRKLLIAAMAAFMAAPAHATTFTSTQTLSSGTLTLGSGDAVTISNGNVGVNITGSSTLENAGSISTQGGRAVDHNSAASAVINNTGTINSAGNNAVAGRNTTAGAGISVTNSGTLSSGGSEAVTFNNMIGANSLTNNVGGQILSTGADAMRPGQNGSVVNHGTIWATPTGTTDPSGSDGIDLRTQKFVTVTNDGIIRGRAGIATDGANVGPSKLTLTNNEGGSIEALNGSGLNLDGVNTTVLGEVTNDAGATIKGGCLAASLACDGDGIDVDGVLTLDNYGDVLGLGAKGDNNPEGIAAGGGSITNRESGRIIGSSLTLDAPNGDNTKSGNGILIDNSSGAGAPAALTVENHGMIWGKTGFAIRTIGTQADSIDNRVTGIVQGAGSGSAIELDGGADQVDNAGTIVSDTGKAVDLGAGDDVFNVLGGEAVIDGDLEGGMGADTLNFQLEGGQFDFGGAISGFETINLTSGTVNLGAAATVMGGTVYVGSGARLAGAATVGNVENSGAIAPAGTLTMDGNLVLANGPRLEFDLGTASDALAVTGALSVNGMSKVQVAVTGGEGFATGDYSLASFGSATGVTAVKFALGDLPHGYGGTLELTANALVLHVAMADSTPNAFSFANAPDLATSTWHQTKVVTVGGINVATPVSVAGGEYRINGGVWSATAGSVVNGDLVQLRVMTAATALTTKKAVLDIGGFKASVLTKTAAAGTDANPDALSFPNVNLAQPNTLYKSPNFVPAGYDTATPVSITGSGCVFRVGASAYDNMAKTISPGQELRLNVTSPATNGTKFSCRITLGTISSTWIGKTVP